MWQAFLFGPSVLDENGQKLESKKDFSYSDVYIANPRSVIGYYEPGHYCLVMIAGRRTASKVMAKKKNYGMNLSQVSEYMYSLGCKAAYNLDGGRSALMCFRSEIITANDPKKGRPLGDVIVVVEPGSVQGE